LSEAALAMKSSSASRCHRGHKLHPAAGMSFAQTHR
jgi:hypothetical protein